MIKTEEATLFSGFEAIALAPGGAGIRIFLGQPKPLGFRPAPLGCPRHQRLLDRKSVV